MNRRLALSILFPLAVFDWKVCRQKRRQRVAPARCKPANIFTPPSNEGTKLTCPYHPIPSPARDERLSAVPQRDFSSAPATSPAINGWAIVKNSSSTNTSGTVLIAIVCDVITSAGLFVRETPDLAAGSGFIIISQGFVLVSVVLVTLSLKKVTISVAVCGAIFEIAPESGASAISSRRFSGAIL